jgi:hypothetical protein
MKGITDLPIPKKVGGRKAFELPYDLFLEQWVVPSGVVVTLATTSNFGYVILPEKCRDKRGFVIPKRIFRW